MVYDKIIFPVFVLHTDNIELIDGILFIDNQILDDTNMLGDTLGKRRLQTPMKGLYNLKYMVEDISELIQHQGKYYIDNVGFFFEKIKRTKVNLKYHKILRVEKKNIVSMLWIKNCPFPFPLKRPLPENASWAGVLYRQGVPWLLYDLAEEQKKDTWRKI
tara:strand:- start:119 stop:598 length:480 start_codon:yes stop_codon:yes gene_type:complete